MCFSLSLLRVFHRMQFIPSFPRLDCSLPTKGPHDTLYKSTSVRPFRYRACARAPARGGRATSRPGRWSPLPRQPDPPCPAASQTGSGRFTPPYCKPVRSNYSPALGMDKAAPQITNLIYRLWPATLLEAARPSSRREAES